jgi:hypothetical protein
MTRSVVVSPHVVNNGICTFFCHERRRPKTTGSRNSEDSFYGSLPGPVELTDFRHPDDIVGYVKY